MKIKNITFPYTSAKFAQLFLSISRLLQFSAQLFSTNPHNDEFPFPLFSKSPISQLFYLANASIFPSLPYSSILNFEVRFAFFHYKQLTLQSGFLISPTFLSKSQFVFLFLVPILHNFYLILVATVTYFLVLRFFIRSHHCFVSAILSLICIWQSELTDANFTPIIWGVDYAVTSQLH